MLIRNFLIAIFSVVALFWGFARWQPLLHELGSAHRTARLASQHIAGFRLPLRLTTTAVGSNASSVAPEHLVALPAYPASWSGSGAPHLNMILNFGPDTLQHVSTHVTALSGVASAPDSDAATDWLVDLLDANGKILTTHRIRDPRSPAVTNPVHALFGLTDNATLTSLRLPFPRQAKQALLRPATATRLPAFNGQSGRTMTMAMATKR